MLRREETIAELLWDVLELLMSAEVKALPEDVADLLRARELVVNVLQKYEKGNRVMSKVISVLECGCVILEDGGIYRCSKHEKKGNRGQVA